MYRHLVAVEVGIECRTDQRMQLNRLAFDQHRLKCLNTQAVQGRRTVQQHRMFADHFFENIPHDRLFGFHHALAGLDGSRQAHRFEPAENERLEQFQRHLLGQTALVQFQLRTHHDHRTAGVVHALAQQVLTETSALALDHVGQGFQLALVRAGHRLAAAAIVQQRVHCLLQHALLVAHDDVWRLQFKQTAQAIVTVDHAAVQIVQVGSRETSAVQRHQWTQFRRQYRQHFQHHPLRLDAGRIECFQHFQALGVFFDLGFRTGCRQIGAYDFDFAGHIQTAQQRTNTFRAHHRGELIAVFFGLGEIVVFRQQLTAIQRGHAGLRNHIGFKIQHAFDVAQSHVQHHAETRGQRLQKPDMRNRAGQLDMPHAFTTHLGQGNFHAALFTDHTAVFQTLVLAAQAFIILNRPENLGTEQSIALRLEGAVIDGFRFLDFAVRPRADLFRRCKADLDRIEFFFLCDLFEQIQQ